jgi:hypothetical protein
MCESLCTGHGRSLHRPEDGEPGRDEKARGRTASMNEAGKSDRLIVPKKPPNKSGQNGAEAVEGRGLAKGNTNQPNFLGFSYGFRQGRGQDDMVPDPQKCGRWIL